MIDIYKELERTSTELKFKEKTMLLNPHIKEFTKYLSDIKNYSEHTITSYSNDLEKFNEFLYESYPNLEDIKLFTKKQIRLFLRHTKKENLSKKTYNRRVASIKGFCKFLYKTKVLETDITLTINSLRLDQSLPEYISIPEIKNIFKNFTENDFLAARESLIFELFYGSGLRLSELWQLTFKDIDNYNLRISTVRKGGKKQYLPVAKLFFKKLKTYSIFRGEKIAENGTEDTDHIFISKNGVHISKRQIQRIVSKTLVRLATISKTSPHVLRHTFATHLLDMGADIMDVKELLGHKSISTTQIYTHVSLEKLKNVYKQAFPKSEE